MKQYKAMLVEMFTSKKFNTLLAAISAVLSMDPVAGIAMSEKTVLEIVALVIAWMIAQGQADKGKAAAKIAVEGSDNQPG